MFSQREGRLPLALLVAAVVGFTSPAAAAPRYSKAYDQHFREASALHLPGRPWKKLKAQGIQESGLRPDVCSKAGACGVMQFMPRTWEEEAKRLGYIGVPRSVARASIFASASYMDRCIGFWSVNRSPDDRDMLGLAGYNAGNGNILAAQRAAGGAMDYATIMAYLHLVTGEENARETRGYAPRIYRIWQDLEADKT